VLLITDGGHIDALYRHVAQTWLGCHSVVAMETSGTFTNEHSIIYCT